MPATPLHPRTVPPVIISPSIKPQALSSPQSYRATNSGCSAFRMDMISSFNCGASNARQTRFAERQLTLKQWIRETHSEMRLDRIAINCSFAINVLLLAAKIVALHFNFMLVLLASVLDSALDVVSGSVLWITSLSMNVYEPHNYPAGKSRFEPIGVIVFSTIMATSSLQIIIFSSMHLAENLGTNYTPPITPGYILGITLGVVVTKLVMYFICLWSTSPLVEAYATDHRNDVLLNTATFLVMLVLRYKPSVWWLDETGAMAIALYIMQNWIRTGLDQVKQLAAYTASEDEYLTLQRIIKQYSEEADIRDLKVYHFGPRFFVEITIFLPAEEPLSCCYELLIGLKGVVENLDTVEKCFISMDYAKGSKESKIPSSLESIDELKLMHHY